MTRPRIGVVTIGQSPRPDLVDPLRQLFKHGEIIEVGALDQMDRSGLPPNIEPHYPLFTQLRDGTPVVVDEEFLGPRVQMAVANVEHRGVIATLIACAGPFATIQSAVPLIKPFSIAVTVFHTLGICRLGVLCPNERQSAASRLKWSTAGFDPVVWAAPEDSMEPSIEWVARQLQCSGQLDGIVLDYYGHSAHYSHVLQQEIRLPVVDLGRLAMAIVTSIT